MELAEEFDGFPTVVFCWGNTSDGELGLGGIEEDHIVVPTRLQCFSKENSVKDIVCGKNHTVALLQDGSVYSCGNNDLGQLGQSKSRSRLEKITSLSHHSIVNISCGFSHSLALNGAGQVFAWGRNFDKELGLASDEEFVVDPRMVKALAVKEVMQIACGGHHSLVLTSSGELFSWGQNTFGQLGLGAKSKHEAHPVLIASLSGIPISQIAAGGYHSFALSMSGALFVWGKNDFGQLGVNDEADRASPTLQHTLRTQYIKYISCGEDHTAALTKDGGVFTFGAGMYGQLGHVSRANEILPRKVMELMGSVVTQIACGRCHTMAYVPSRGRVYAFGLGGGGQLGLSLTINVFSPMPISGPWTTSSHSNLEARNGASSSKSESGVEVHKTISDHNDILDGSEQSYPCEYMDINGELGSAMDIDAVADDLKQKASCTGSSKVVEVNKIISGGDHSFVIATPLYASISSKDFRVVPPESRILALDNSIIKEAPKIQENECVPQDLMSYIETIFSSSACLNGSYLKVDNSHYKCSSKNHGIDMNAASYGFKCIKEAPNTSIADLVNSCIVNNLIPSLSSTVPDIEAMRLYLYIPFSHLFHDTYNNLKTLIYPFAKAILRLPEKALKILESWWSQLEVSHFTNLVMVFKKVVILLLEEIKPNGEFENFEKLEFMQISLVILSRLNKVNIENEELIPYREFYIPEVTDTVDISYDYAVWSRQSHQRKFQFCDYPFVFDAQAKTKILQTDSAIQMQSAVDSAMSQNFASFFLPVSPVNPYLLLSVTRENIVRDTIAQLSQYSSSELKKPLKIIFCNEEAVDAGGVRKEFFMLLIRAILDPQYGMFVQNTETRCIWFCAQTFEEEVMFHLIGVLCGLAIYNFTIIDLPFPLVLYKKLLKEKVKLEDLKGYNPVLAKGLQDLLQYEEDDVEETFSLNFEVAVEVFGEPVQYELKPDGKNISVTNENREEYVDLYVDFILNKSVDTPFNAFDSGFHKVCNGKVMELFHAQELMALVIGNEEYDWEQLEKNAQYKDELNQDHPNVKMFWKVFHSLSEDNKRKFLLFLTGSDRIPILGMKAVPIIFQPMHVSDNFLPVAHTCFNILDLPLYSNEEALKTKLLQSIQHTEGFGLA